MQVDFQGKSYLRFPNFEKGDSGKLDFLNHAGIFTYFLTRELGIPYDNINLWDNGSEKLPVLNDYKLGYSFPGMEIADVNLA